MAKATQFCIALVNKPGTLARLCRILARAKVNVAGISVSENNECSWVRLLASPAATVRATLRKGRFTYTTVPVLRLGLKNQPGELARVASRLARNGININYVYGSSVGGVGAAGGAGGARGGASGGGEAGPDAERSMLIVGAADINAAAKALGSEGRKRPA